MARVRVINGRQSSDLIGANFTNSASQTIFNLGSFAVESNFTGRRERDYNNELSSFATPITLEGLNLTMDESQKLTNVSNNVELNLDYSDIKSFSRFGSAAEIMRVTLRNIIDKYPASLYINNQIDVGGNITAQDYIYDSIQNISTFKIPTSYVSNNYGLIFDVGNTSISNDDNLRNLNLSFQKYVIWSKDSSNDFSHEIIGFTGDTKSNPFIKIQAKGETFENVTGTTVESTFHLRPKVVEYNKFLSDLGNFEKYILNNRSDNFSEFTFIIKNPSIGERGDITYDNEEFSWRTLDGYNPDIGTGLFNAFSDSLIGIGEKYDEIKSDLVSRLLTPSSLKLYDTTQDGKIGKLLRLYGREFDQIKTFIDSLVHINKTSYDKINNVPDRLVKNLAETFGWDTFSITEESDIVNAFFSTEVVQNESNKLPAEIDIELWRRILINTNYYWKSKGTRNAIKSIFRLIGIPESFVNITEYVYTVDGKINPNNVELQLEDLPTASLPYDKQGYPIAPVENNDFYFQLSGNTDGGQAYINLYRDLGFRVNRTIDNKKSWVEAGRVDRVHYSTPNYYQIDSKLIINTKEVDATLDIARGIEYDVFCYNQEIDDPITSSAVTRPYIYVNVELDIDDPLSFSLPDQPLSGSNVLMSFNGITLTPLNEIDNQSTGSTEYDYYYDRTTNRVVLNPNIPASASTVRDVISVSYIGGERRGITGYTSVNYVIERPQVFADGAELLLDEIPKGDIQLIVNGKTMTKGTSLFTGDFVLDTTQTPARIRVQNSDLKQYLNSGNGNAVRITYIYDDGETNAIKKSEAHRVDSLNSSKFFFNGGVNRNVYIMNYAAFDINSIKITVNGITLTNGKDFNLNPANKRQVYLPAGIKLGDIIGAYYIIDDGTITPPLLPPDDTFPDIQDMSFLEYLELIQRRLINAKNRKTITDNKGGFYPTVTSIYNNYMKRSYLANNDPIKSKGYTFSNLYPFIQQYNSFFQRFVDQLLPATIILNKSGILIRNTSFSRQKFRYPRGVNFDPQLQWLGDDGSEFIRKIPKKTYEWSDDFVCIEETTTTTTTTTTVAPTTTTTTTAAPTTTAPESVEVVFDDVDTRPIDLIADVSDGTVDGQFVLIVGTMINYTGAANFRIRLEVTNVVNTNQAYITQYSEAPASTDIFTDGDTILIDKINNGDNYLNTFDIGMLSINNTNNASADLSIILETIVNGNFEETDRITYNVIRRSIICPSFNNVEVTNVDFDVTITLSGGLNANDLTFSLREDATTPLNHTVDIINSTTVALTLLEQPSGTSFQAVVQRTGCPIYFEVIIIDNNDGGGNGDGLGGGFLEDNIV